MEKLTKEEFQEMYGNMVIDMVDDGIDEIIDEVERLGDSSTAVAEASMYILLGIVVFKLLDEEDRRTIQEVFLSLA